MTHIKITVKNDFRKFRKDEVIEFDVKPYGITYIAGRNGQGKTTILRRFRAVKDSLEKANKKLFDGMESSQNQMDKIETSVMLDVEGFDYDEVFCLDSVTDDPVNFENAATAYGLISGGGMAMMRKSKGEKTMLMFYQFYQKIEKCLSEMENGGKGKKKLVIIDEIDEGFDVSLQMRFNHLITARIINKFECDVIAVTHNSLCMLSPSPSGTPYVYDLDAKAQCTPSEYFESKTGYRITLEEIEKK